jgi:hypothetical protein
MQFDLKTLDVDGSLANPVVVATVLLWGVVLASATALAFRTWMRSVPVTTTDRPLRLLVGVVLGVLYLATPVTQFLIGNMLYQLLYRRDGEILTSVGFWGGPPIIPSWCLGACGGAAAALSLPRLSGRVDCVASV